jgi:hypothetical protein
VGNTLHILVEGDQDDSFVQKVVKPWLLNKGKYNNVETFAYANRKKEITENYVKTIKEKQEDILCLTDSTHASCISGRIDDLINNGIGTFERKAIIVVVKEIESWYLAGVDNQCCRRIHIPYFERTEQIKKEEFHSIIAKSKYKPKPACRLEMLKYFNIVLASQRNISFYRFYSKYLI